jgi:signal transduction histidine kinase
MAPRRVYATAIVFVCLAFIAWMYWRTHRTESVVPSHSYQLQAGQMGEWTAFGGEWKASNGVLYNKNSDVRGGKLITGSKGWENYTLRADIKFKNENGDMGVIIRSNDEEAGLDAYNGYYVGLRTTPANLVIGRSNYGWVEARPVPLPGGINPSVWYRFRVTTYNCNIAASVQNLETLQTAWIAFKERSCVKTGRIGLRTVDAEGMWRNISIAPAGRNDYLEMQRHAASVEQPVVLNGPPWWTPWHVGMLFAGISFLALLMQLVYFRMQQWKTFAITQERQRLAHEIHDTMAQSFAGVGYQIQGIRSNLLRGDRQDPTYIADQLSVAYQLIRRCHAESSETIAILASPSSRIQENLLETLTDTAHQLTGSRIKTISKLYGTSVPLSLRTADALLHIGEEAIANAVSHSNSTLLTITLSYKDGVVELMVKDNGKGFDYTPETAGLGILGMQKRARDVGGSLCLRSAPGEGTEISITAKLQRKNLRERILTKAKSGIWSIPD